MCSSFPAQKRNDDWTERSRIYSIHSPLLSRTSRYRALLNLRAVEEILERERPISSNRAIRINWPGKRLLPARRLEFR